MNKFYDKYGIDLVLLIYIVGSSVALGFFIACIWALFKGYYLIHPLICLTSIIGSIGLIWTAILCIKDWRRWRNKNK